MAVAPWLLQLEQTKQSSDLMKGLTTSTIKWIPITANSTTTRWTDVKPSFVSPPLTIYHGVGGELEIYF